jgi:hypothetical protein
MAFNFQIMNDNGKALFVDGFINYEVIAQGTTNTAPTTAAVSFSNPSGKIPLIFVRPTTVGTEFWADGYQTQELNGSEFMTLNSTSFRFVRGEGPLVTYKYAVVVPSSAAPANTGYGMALMNDAGSKIFDTETKYMIVDYVYPNTNYSLFDMTVNVLTPYPGHERYVLASSLFCSRVRELDDFGVAWVFRNRMSILSETQIRLRRVQEDASSAFDVGAGVSYDKTLYPMMSGFMKI